MILVFICCFGRRFCNIVLLSTAQDFPVIINVQFSDAYMLKGPHWKIKKEM
jgi:hypothetical protein